MSSYCGKNSFFFNQKRKKIEKNFLNINWIFTTVWYVISIETALKHYLFLKKVHLNKNPQTCHFLLHFILNQNSFQTIFGPFHSSRSASLVVTSLGLPTIQNATPTSGPSPDLTAPNSRRGSAQSCTSASYLGTQHERR